MLGMLNPGRISRIWASDIDPDMLDVAGRNLSLLTRSGMETRIAQLRRLYERYEKPVHLEAIASARRLMGKLPRPFRLSCFRPTSWPDFPLPVRRMLS